MFTHEGWEYDGPYFRFPPRNVLPKPVQKPHPPLRDQLAPAGRWLIMISGEIKVLPRPCTRALGILYRRASTVARSAIKPLFETA
jgi:hypothetical protein